MNKTNAKTKTKVKKRNSARARRGKLRVFIVDDHPIVRHGIAQLINQQRDLMICGEAADGREALARVAAAQPDIVLVDLTLQKSDGLELIKNLRVRHRKLPVLVLSIHDELVYAQRTLRAGARGYLMKHEATDNVLRAIRTVLSGALYLSDQMWRKLKAEHPGATKIGHGSPVACLSDRELEVFRLLGQGRSTREIAGELHVSTHTVETHRENIKHKLNLHSGLELLQHAIRWAETEGAG